MLGREVADNLLGQGIAHPAAGDQKWLLRCLQQRRRFEELGSIRTRPRDGPQPRLEEGLRIIEGEFLRILRQRQERRPAVRRIKHRGGGLRQRRNDLGWVGDAVPVSRHGLEGVVDRDGRVPEMLDLLHDRVRQPVGEGVAGDEQHRQPVGVRRSSGGHHVEGAGADRRRRDHDLPTPLGFGEANGRQRHRLLVLAAPGGETILNRLERLREAGDVAMPEDGEHAGEQGHANAFDLRELLRQPAGHGLSHCETNCRASHAVSSLVELREATSSASYIDIRGEMQQELRTP